MSELQSILNLRENPTFVVNTFRHTLAQPFAFDLLLHQFAKEGKHILLILLNQNWQHYSAVATKCGLNIKHLKDNNVIEVVDIFDYNGTSNGSDYSYDWALFNRDINEKMSILSENSVVLVDDLSVLLSIGCTLSKIYLFVRKLKAYLGKNTYCLFIGTYYKFEDEQLYSLITSMIHECDVWLDSDKPKTGYSLQINGIATCRNMNEDSTTEFNYKISNRNVIFKRL